MEKNIILKVLNPGVINRNCTVIPVEVAEKVIKEITKEIITKEKFEDTTNEE